MHYSYSTLDIVRNEMHETKSCDYTSLTFTTMSIRHCNHSRKQGLILLGDQKCVLESLEIRA